MKTPPKYRNAVAARAIALLALCVVGTLTWAAPRGAQDDACNLLGPRPLEFGVEEATERFYSKLAIGQEANVMIVGDSMSFRANSYNWFLRDHLHTAFGNGGEGYFGIGDGFTKSPNGNSARPGQRLRELDLSPDNDPQLTSTTGNIRWLGVNNARPLPWGAWSPDGIYTHIDGPGAIELDFYGTEATLHYIRFPGGGRFRLYCNNVDLGVYSADNPPSMPVLADVQHARLAPKVTTGSGVVRHVPLNAEQFARRVRHESIAITTGALTNDTLNTLRIEWAGGGLVQMNGLEMRSGGAGASYARIARGGQGPRDFLKGINKTVAAQLIEMSPDLMIVMLDWSTYAEREVFEQETNALLDFYQKAIPDTPIILMSHHPFIADMALESDIYRKIACQRGLGYINLYDLFANWSEMASLGLMHDTVHFSAAGGAWFGAYVFSVLEPEP